MATNTLVWIIVAAVAALIVVGVLAYLARNRRRHVAGRTASRGDRQKTQRVEKREAFAEETEAKARAAKAEAEAKAAEAARLQESAASHREAATTSRDELDAQRERVDALDPKSKASRSSRRRPSRYRPTGKRLHPSNNGRDGGLPLRDDQLLNQHLAQPLLESFGRPAA